ncbi:cytochrome c family protein [Parasphingopyxis algicola]|uniref:c-type cytochrome n=1 Tax=Parasphingopyxis algicola TaxID=2026624 RepID=UPI0015A4D49F|nr:cytochrome c family protein [Parasphingopyxis algicola]QLC24990.1 cytochrome c family protein [Parasphingopyxis algicola]
MSQFNTIAGWSLAGGIVALGASIVTGEIFHSERPETMGYVVEGVVEEGGEEEAEMTMAMAFPSVTVEQGEAVFRRCASCHTINEGGASGIGPNLWGKIGRDIASVPGFNYSGALSEIEGSWNFDNMSDWLARPAAFAQGTTMSFAGLSDPLDRAAVILYMNANGSNMPLPEPPAADETEAEDEEIEAEEAADPEAVADIEGGDEAAAEASTEE